MRGKIQQAYFGERGGGHRLLKATAPDDPIFQRLEGITDHLSAPERGLQWRPYMSGYPFQGRYVLARTFAGPVTTRTGWAFTHTLVLEIEDVAECADLQALIGLLAIASEMSELQAVQLPDCNAPTFEPPSGRVGAAVQQLLERTPNTRPVVWLGQDGFEDLLTRVWAGLWPDARAIFSFRTAFKPDDANRTDTALFNTALVQPGRWAGFPIVRQDASHALLSPAEALLAGKPSSLRGRVVELALPGDDLRALRQVEAIDTDLAALETLKPAEVRMLMRRLASAAPSVAVAEGVKAEVLRKLASAVHGVDSGFVYTLRNVEPAPFGAAINAVADAVMTWTEQNLRDSQEEVATWLGHTDADAVSWWRKSVRGGVRRGLKDGSEHAARTVWDLWRAEPQIVQEMVEMPEVRALADVLVNETPTKLGAPVASAVLNAAEGSRWVRLYAAVAASAHSLADALSLILKKFDDALGPALKVVAERVPSRDITRAVTARENRELDTWAASLIAANPDLRRELDPRTERGQTLWLDSVDAGAAIWTGVDNVDQWRDAVLDALFEDGPAAKRLVGHIARTSAADVSGTQWESRIWNVLPADAVEGFIRATAAGWITRFRSDPRNVPLPHETVRAQVLTESALFRARSSTAASDLAAGLTAVERFALGEDAVIAWLQANTAMLTHLQVADAERLGQMVASKRWRDGTEEIYRCRSHARALYTALRHCRDLLPVLARIGLAVEGLWEVAPSADDWYVAFHAFLDKELDRGPEHDGIWERAGGTLSSIRGGNARERWWSALDELRRGRGGHGLSLSRLLDVLRKDFPRNTDLELLRKTAPHA